MGTHLFRSDYHDRLNHEIPGDIRIAAMPSLGLMTLFAVLVIISAVTFLVTATYDRKVSLPGVLVPLGGIINVYSPESATVVETFVSEGSDVQTGTPLVRLQVDKSTESGRLSQLQAQSIAKRKRALTDDIEAARSQYLQRQESLSRQLRSLSSEVATFEADLDNSKERVKLARVTVKRYRELSQQGFMPLINLQQKEEELLDLELRERSILHQIENAHRLIDGAKADLAANQGAFSTAAAKNSGDQALLDQEEKETAARNGWLIEAPHAGRVVNINVLVGQYAAAGVAVVTLLPSEAEHRPLEASLYATSQTIGFIEAGQTVAMQYAAFPYQKFGLIEGKVLSVGTSPINPQDIPPGQAESIFSSNPNREPLYRIQVELPSQRMKAGGQDIALKAGMSLIGQVHLEQRYLWEWLFEPLLALRHSA